MQDMVNIRELAFARAGVEPMNIADGWQRSSAFGAVDGLTMVAIKSLRGARPDPLFLQSRGYDKHASWTDAVTSVMRAQAVHLVEEAPDREFFEMPWYAARIDLAVWKGHRAPLVMP